VLRVPGQFRARAGTTRQANPSPGSGVSEGRSAGVGYICLSSPPIWLITKSRKLAKIADYWTKNPAADQNWKFAVVGDKERSCNGLRNRRKAQLSDRFSVR